jgi:hypothetical protein
VNLHGWVCDMLRAWIADRRPATTNSHSIRVRDRVHALTRNAESAGLQFVCVLQHDWNDSNRQRDER